MLNINTLNRLYLGVQGENRARTISIDVSPWLEEYPNGTIYLWHIRNGEDTEYIPAYVEVDLEQKALKWQPSSLDTFYAGCGTCGISINEDDVIKKTKNIHTYTIETGSVSPGTPRGLADYETLDNLPKILGVTLKGNKSLVDLGVFDDTLTRDDLLISAKKAGEKFAQKQDVEEEINTLAEDVLPIVTINESTGRAEQDIEEGQFVILNDGLYQATRDITAGEVVQEGDLIERADGAINALRADLIAATQETSQYHLGFYLDENGDLIQDEDY